jgi:dihydrofolate reductase
MGKVVVDLSVSLDGFIAGAGDGSGAPLGRGGEALFAWMGGGKVSAGDDRDPRLAPPPASEVIIQEWIDETGAMISGRRTFDIANGWAEGHPIDAPIFVVTHQPPTEGEWSERVEFVPEGFDRALELAQKAAGDKMISVCGADLVQQALRAGKLDEVRVSVTPVLLGDGVRLLDNFGPDPVTLEQLRVIPSEGVTHLAYRVVR